MSCKPTELLSHKKIRVGKGFWRSSSPVPHSEPIQLQHVVQGLVWQSFQYLQKWRCQYLSNTCPSILLSSWWKECFWNHDWNFWFAVCVCCLLSDCSTHQRRVSLCHLLCFIPLCSCGQKWDPLTFLFFRVNKSNTPSCSSYTHILLPHICFLSWLSHNLHSWIRYLNTKRMNLGSWEREKLTVFHHNLRLVTKTCFRSPRVKERMTDPEECCISWWQLKLKGLIQNNFV